MTCILQDAADADAWMLICSWWTSITAFDGEMLLLQAALVLRMLRLVRAQARGCRRSALLWRSSSYGYIGTTIRSEQKEIGGGFASRRPWPVWPAASCTWWGLTKPCQTSDLPQGDRHNPQLVRPEIGGAALLRSSCRPPQLALVPEVGS